MTRRHFLALIQLTLPLFGLATLPKKGQYFFHLSLNRPEGDLLSVLEANYQAEEREWIQELNARYHRDGRLLLVEYARDNHTEELKYLFRSYEDFLSWEKEILEQRKFALSEVPSSVQHRTSQGYV